MSVMFKRAFDVLISAIVLMVLAPLLVLLAVLVKLTSPGPIFYRATRMGRHGRPFKLLKFRSMVMNADQIGPGVTGSGDARITPVGRILRRTKLDEFPQLLNVLWGEMSLVGPRPEDPRYTTLYTAEQRQILTVRPGITSLASITYRNEEAMLVGDNWESHYIEQIMPAKLAIDLEYARNPSLIRDLIILFRTGISLFRL